jgi:DUF917 family protein
MSWQLTAADLPDLARGATLLGTGGGGDPYIGKMLVERVLGDGSITILDPDELADDLFVIPTAQMGAPAPNRRSRSVRSRSISASEQMPRCRSSAAASTR